MAHDAPIEQRAAASDEASELHRERHPLRTADASGHEEMPRVRFTRRQLLASILFVISAIAFLYFVLPRLVGLRVTWNRIRQGNVWWLGLGAGLEICSFGAYIAVFRAVFVRGQSRIGWRESYQITMAGLAATRLFAAGGAGGIALTAWAVRRSGMGARTVACRMIAFLALLYGVYMGTLVICGLGLYLGIFEGSAPFAITIVPAIFGAVVIVCFSPCRCSRTTLNGSSAGGERCTDGSDRWLDGWPLPPRQPGPACAPRSAWSVQRIRTCWVPSGGGASTSPCSGPASTLSATPRPMR